MIVKYPAFLRTEFRVGTVPQTTDNCFTKSKTLFFLACVASVSVRFRSKERPRKGIFGFDRARNETRAKQLTAVPRSLLLNRTETLATQAMFFQVRFSLGRELLFSSLAYFQQHETTTIVAKRFWDTFLSSFGICMKQVIHIHKLRLTKVPPLVKH